MLTPHSHPNPRSTDSASLSDSASAISAGSLTHAIFHPGHFLGSFTQQADSEKAAKEKEEIVEKAVEAAADSLFIQESVITGVLAQAFQSFWGVPAHLRLFSVSQKPLYFWRQDDFYVSQASSEIQLRLSDGACATLLSRILGDRHDDMLFSFSSLSGFEASLLTTFSKQLLTLLAKRLIQPSALKPKEFSENLSENTSKQTSLHLVWMIRPEEAPELSQNKSQPESPDAFAAEAGKLILTLPLSALKAPPENSLESAALLIEEQWLGNAFTTVGIAIGSGKIPIADFERLEADDIVLLEQSQIKQLFLTSGYQAEEEEPIPFEANILNPQRIQLDFDADKNLSSSGLHSPASPLTQQEFLDMSHTTLSASRQALLDNLLIEVGAQFTPVKLPLQQVKQMSEGLVVEIGDLIHNDVMLTVDGKPLALGELVIIGDKFGVKIVSVTPDGQSTPERPVKAYPMPDADQEQSSQSSEKPQKTPSATPQNAASQKTPAPAAASTGTKEPAASSAPIAEKAPPPAAAESATPAAMDDFLNDDFGDDDDDW